MYKEQEHKLPAKLTVTSQIPLGLLFLKSSANTYKVDMPPRILPLLVNFWATAAVLQEAESCYGVNKSHINHKCVYV